MSHADDSLLVGDIGGTRSRLAIGTGPGPWPALHHHRELVNDEVGSFEEQLQRYLKALPAAPPSRACLAIAGPVDGDLARLTNRPWTIDANALAAMFGLDAVVLVNDFAALAHSLAFLPPSALATLQQGRENARGPLAVVGPGTGLGVALVVDPGIAQRILATEGGHVTFAAASERDWALREAIARDHGAPVSAEDVLRGDGLARLYAELGGAPATPAEVSARAGDGGDRRAAAAVDWYLEMLGRFAGDVALVGGATGGVFLGGGVLPRLAPRLATSGFLDAFRGKGPLGDQVAGIPVHLVKDTAAALGGAWLAAAASDASTLTDPP